MHMERCIEQLYANIDTADIHMERCIEQLVGNIFEMDKHRNHVAIKVWETKPAVWLSANQAPTDDHSLDTSADSHTVYMILDTISWPNAPFYPCDLPDCYVILFSGSRHPTKPAWDFVGLPLIETYIQTPQT